MPPSVEAERTVAMATTDFYTLKDKNDDLLLAAINVAVLMAPYGAVIPERIADIDGKLLELPEGWFFVGEIEKQAGVDLAPDMKVSGPEGYGSRGRRRDFIEDETFTIDFTAQETRVQQLEGYYDLNITGDSYKDGQFFAKKRRAARVREYSAILLGYDGDPGKEIYPYWVFPKVTKESQGKQSLAETNVLTYPWSLSAKEDPEYGALFGFGIAGPGFTPELARAMGVSSSISAATAFTFSLDGATGGTFSVTVGSTTASGQAYDVSSSDLQAALRGAGADTAVVTGDATAGFTLTGLSAVPTVNASELTGGTWPKAVTVTQV